MISKQNYGKIINFTINILLGIGLVATGLILGHSLTVWAFITGFVVSMGCGYTICDIIPAVGPIVTKGIKNKWIKYFVSTGINGLIYICCISLCCQFVSFGPKIFQIWPGTFPYLFLVGYVILLVFMPLCIKLADVLTK